MKRRIEGSLHEPVYTSSGPDFLEVASQTIPAFADVDDFIAKSAILTAAMKRHPGTLRAEFASNLTRHVSQVRRWLRAGVNPRALDDAVTAALTLAALCTELREDSKTKPVKTKAGKITRGKVSRTAFFEAFHANHGKQTAMAADLRVSETTIKKLKKLYLQK